MDIYVKHKTNLIKISLSSFVLFLSYQRLRVSQRSRKRYCLFLSPLVFGSLNLGLRLFLRNSSNQCPNFRYQFSIWNLRLCLLSLSLESCFALFTVLILVISYCICECSLRILDLLPWSWLCCLIFLVYADICARCECVFVSFLCSFLLSLNLCWYFHNLILDM